MHRENSPLRSVKDFLRAQDALSSREDRDCPFPLPSLADSSRFYLTRHCERLHHCSRLDHGLFVFLLRIRIVDDACAGLEIPVLVFKYGRPPCDSAICVTVQTQITNIAPITDSPQ